MTTETDRELLKWADLHEILSYDADAGVFVWKDSNSNVSPVGSVAGRSVNGDGYLQIGINGQRYKAHRLAWFYVYGVWPDQIDHINGDRSDNRIVNLRSVTVQKNNHNRVHPNRSNSSGFLGVSKRSDGRFQAEIRVDGKKRFLGVFSTPEEASNMYQEAKKEMHIGWIDRTSIVRAAAAIGKEMK